MAKDNFCIYCGFKLFPEDHFYPNCGKRLDEGPNTQPKTSKYEPSKVVDGIDLSQVNEAKKAQNDYYSSSTKSKTTYATTTPDYTYYKNQKLIEFKQILRRIIMAIEKDAEKILEEFSKTLDTVPELEGTYYIDYYSSSTKSKTTYATTTPDYTYYKNQIKKLKESYEAKEKKVLELLEKKFPSGQMSYYRFKGEVDSCRVSFFKEVEAAENMIELSDEYSDKIANELKNKIKTLQSIVGKLGDLQSELIISISNEADDGDEEIKNFIDEMNELIKSVRDYE